MRGARVRAWLRTPSWAAAGVCAAWALFAGAVVVPTHAEQSPTRDEITHLTRGLAALWTGDTRLSVNHPPLANMVAALPGAVMGPRVDMTALPGWADADVIAVTRAYAATDYAAVRRQWLAGRLAMLVFPLGLLMYLAWFVRGRFGAWAAAGTLGLVATHPTVLAHLSLTTTDMPVMVFLVIAACELVRVLEGPGRRALVGLTLATGMAAASKFSGAFMAVVAAAVLLLWALRGRGRYAEGRRFVRWCGDVAVLGAGVVLCVDAAYLFDRTGWTVGAIVDARPPTVITTADLKSGYLARETMLGALPRWLPVPLPYTYVFGAEMLRRQTVDGRGTWFLGKITTDAGPRYFPMLLILKSPIALIIAFAGGLLLVIGRRRMLGGGGRDLLVIGAVGGIFLVAAMTSRMTIGVRHVLVCVPVMALVAGVGIELLARTRGRRAASLALAAAVVPCAAATLMTRPDFLGYFNYWAGGDESERHISVIGEDWGQDTRALGRMALEQGWAPFYYRPAGHTSLRELQLLNVPVEPLVGCKAPSGPGWVAIHDGTVVADPPCRHWREREPALWLRNHVRVYKF